MREILFSITSKKKCAVNLHWMVLHWCGKWLDGDVGYGDDNLRGIHVCDYRSPNDICLASDRIHDVCRFHRHQIDHRLHFDYHSDHHCDYHFHLDSYLLYLYSESWYFDLAEILFGFAVSY